MNWYQWNRSFSGKLCLLSKCEHLKSGRRFHSKVSFRYSSRLAFRKDFNKPVRGTKCNFWVNLKGVCLFFRRSSETQKQRMLIPNVHTATKEQRSCCKCLLQKPSRCWKFGRLLSRWCDLEVKIMAQQNTSIKSQSSKQPFQRRQHRSLQTAGHAWNRSFLCLNSWERGLFDFDRNRVSIQVV